MPRSRRPSGPRDPREQRRLWSSGAQRAALPLRRLRLLLMGLRPTARAPAPQICPWMRLRRRGRPRRTNFSVCGSGRLSAASPNPSVMVRSRARALLLGCDCCSSRARVWGQRFSATTRWAIPRPPSRVCCPRIRRHHLSITSSRSLTGSAALPEQGSLSTRLCISCAATTWPSGTKSSSTSCRIRIWTPRTMPAASACRWARCTSWSARRRR